MFATVASSRVRRSFLAIGLVSAVVSSTFGSSLLAAPEGPRVVRDVTFARVGESELRLDLYLPAAGSPAGLIVWVHGGAWRAGSRASVDLLGMTQLGWAVASVDYRLSTVARFPAQVHDIKAAIRFLRQRAGKYGYPAGAIVIAGSSAGAHLAALVGVTNGNAALEGNVGLDGDAARQARVSSDVQAIVSLYGASDLTTILAQSTPHGLDVRVPALELLLGARPDAVPELARLASPVFHVAAGDPPLYLAHGDRDNQMPINQSHQLEGAYVDLGLPVRFDVMHGSGHGGPAFTSPAALAHIDEFLRRHLAVAQGPAAAPTP
jgi:acetyl esterase/lipase